MTTSVATPWILGLTGGIGSGKSAAAEHFIKLGIDLVDADHAARWVVEPGRPALARIAEHFGASVLQADGQLDRAALRKLIFEVPQERLWLEALLHPLIGEEIRSHLARAPHRPAAGAAVVPVGRLVDRGRRGQGPRAATGRGTRAAARSPHRRGALDGGRDRQAVLADRGASPAADTRLAPGWRGQRIALIARATVSR